MSGLTVRTLAAAACGGAIGAVGRHLVGLASLELLGSAFPWGTLAANVLGSFAMGLFIELGALKLEMSSETRAFVAVGLLGGFTTFSAFAMDVAVLAERQAAELAMLYVSASVILAIGALFAGLAIVRRILV